MPTRWLGSSTRPMVWLGQSTDTSSLCSAYAELKGAPFLTSLGCAIRRPSLERTHFNGQLRAMLGVRGPIMLDSGGFALSRNHAPEWTVRRVGNFIEKVDADIFVTLDHPPRLRDTASDRRSKIGRSMRNYRSLSDRFPDKVIMPVVHGRTLSEIELSLQLLERCAVIPRWVGLGGIVPLLQNRRVSGLRTTPEVFIADALTLVRETYPSSKIHVFGAGGTRTFPAVVAFGADSGDSIGWRQAAGYGSIFLPMKSQRTLRWNGEKRPPRRLLDQSDVSQIERCRCPICLGLPVERRIASARQMDGARCRMRRELCALDGSDDN
jgi:queuine/archaeosine tRNA-ribosyltransferase